MRPSSSSRHHRPNPSHLRLNRRRPSPNYALAEQVKFTDPDIVADYITYPSPKGNGTVRGDLAAADASWRGGRTASHADDAVLRTLIGQPGQSQILSLRMDTQTPIARDQAQPSRLREVPVRIRAMTANGPLNYQGWYRLQPCADGSGWEIHGASVHPVLD